MKKKEINDFIINDGAYILLIKKFSLIKYVGNGPKTPDKVEYNKLMIFKFSDDLKKYLLKGDKISILLNIRINSMSENKIYK